MKTYKQTFWIFAVTATSLLAVAGCSKFLDRKPLQATLSDLNQGALEAQSFGLYSTLRSYGGFSTLPWLDFNSIRDDDAQKGSSTTDGAEINTEFETFKYTKDDWATDTYWNDHYAMINQANQELYIADSIKATDEASLRNIGEACFFRAYAYFDLVKAYGQVPLLNFYSSNSKDYVKPKSPVPALYQQIDSDLNVAANYLPINWEDINGNNKYPGRLTKGAALSLHAQTHLFRSDWSMVVNYTNQVIALNQYSLEPNFPDIWKDGLNGAGKNGPESIFEMQSNVGENGTSYYGVQWGTSQNVRQGGATTAWNLGWGWNTPTQVLQNAWDSTDPRKAQTILYSGRSDGGPAQGGYGATLPAYGPGVALDQPYWNKKVYSDPGMRSFTGEVAAAGGADWINHRIIRYADILLMLAEASNELGDGATAASNLELGQGPSQRYQPCARRFATHTLYKPGANENRYKERKKMGICHGRIEILRFGEVDTCG